MGDGRGGVDLIPLTLFLVDINIERDRDFLEQDLAICCAQVGV